MCLAAWTPRALAIQDQACLIYRGHTVDVSAGNGYFPGEAASGGGRIHEAKNTYLRGTIKGIKLDLNRGKC